MNGSAAEDGGGQPAMDPIMDRIMDIMDDSTNKAAKAKRKIRSSQQSPENNAKKSRAEEPDNVVELVQQYEDSTKISRLLFIARTNTKLVNQALQVVMSIITQGSNVAAYEEAVIIAKNNGIEIEDDKWRQEQERLGRMTDAKWTPLLEDSEHNDLAWNHFFARATNRESRGLIKDAREDFLQCKKIVCSVRSSPQQRVKTGMAILRTSVFLGNQMQVESCMQMLKNDDLSPAENFNLINARGLTLLKGKLYDRAAHSWAELTSEMCDAVLGDDVETFLFASVADVVGYACLCGLASWTREQVKEKFLSNPAFRALLSVGEGAWLNIVSDFVLCRYSPCLHSLGDLRSVLSLDMHISPHLLHIMKTIRSRAVLQYCRPFSAIKLSTMSSLFNVDIQQLESELVELISSGKLKARIDSQEKILYFRGISQRVNVFSKVQSIGDKYNRDIKTLVMNMSLLKNDLVVKSEEKPDRNGSASQRGSRGRGLEEKFDDGSPSLDDGAA